MAAAPGEPAVQAIAERGSVGHTDVERAGGLQDASDFGERACQIMKVLETVAGDDGIEGAVGKGKARGVGLREVLSGSAGAVKVSADSDKWSDAGGEAARARTEIEHAFVGPEVVQNFVHRYFFNR